LYTLADLTQITGAKRRSVQLWAEAGVIQAAPASERAGSGVHREFSRREAIVACIVAAFAFTGIPIGRLLQISKATRTYLKNKRAAASIERAIENSSRVFLALDAATRNFSLLENPTGDETRAVLDKMHMANFATDIIFLNGALRHLKLLKTE
jgi:hypothetical protein